MNSNNSELEENALLLDKVDKKVMVLLTDGRKLMGCLRSVDQFFNLVLSQTIERIYVGREYGEIPRGVFIIRKENVVLVGEVDAEKERQLPLTEVPMDEILSAQRKKKELKEEKQKLLSKALKERGLGQDSTQDMI